VGEAASKTKQVNMQTTQTSRSRPAQTDKRPRGRRDKPGRQATRQVIRPEETISQWQQRATAPGTSRKEPPAACVVLLHTSCGVDLEGADLIWSLTPTKCDYCYFYKQEHFPLPTSSLFCIYPPQFPQSTHPFISPSINPSIHTYIQAGRHTPRHQPTS
jgi:hypothetical protein